MVSLPPGDRSPKWVPVAIPAPNNRLTAITRATNSGEVSLSVHRSTLSETIRILTVARSVSGIA